jgi:hypothetical protein
MTVSAFDITQLVIAGLDPRLSGLISPRPHQAVRSARFRAVARRRDTFFGPCPPIMFRPDAKDTLILSFLILSLPKDEG